MANFVNFDQTLFLTRYPEFADVNPTLLGMYFAEAGLFLDNSGAGVIQDPNQQLILMNMLTAHIAELNRLTTGPDGTAHAVNQLVGRVSSATQGTVTLQADYSSPEGIQQWLDQTKYGAAYNAATAGYRLFRYRAGPRRVFDPIYGGRPWYWNA